MRKAFQKYCIYVIMLFSSSCVVDEQTDIPTIDKDYEEFSTSVLGFSGVCFSKDKDFLLAVSDKLGIFEINFDGSTKRKLAFGGYHDLEGITINTSSGEIYVADETEMTLNKLSTDELSLTELTKIVVENGLSNKGIEGITYGNDTLYVVNQTEPTLLIKYDLRSKKEISRIKINFASYLSDIFYDSTDNSLWICDSIEKKIYHCKLNTELISTQSIEFIAKAEAIAIDKTANVAWIGCDESGKLYKVKLKI